MSKQKFQDLNETVIQSLGGKENIAYFTHCVTRLRFNVKDKGIVNVSEIENKEGVMGTQWSGNQIQIIIGPAVADAFKLISETHGFKSDTNVENADKDENKEKKKFSFMTIADTISGCITPALPVLIGAGMLKVILLVLEMSGVLTPESETYITMSFVSDTAFYFLPVYVGAASARKFGMNMWIGMFLGAVLLHPTFVAMCSDGAAGSVFGIPIYAATYTSSIFPTIISVLVASYIEKTVNKYTPDFLKTMIVPLVTILLMMPLMLCLLGPLGAFIGNYITIAVTWLYDTIGFAAVGIFAAVLPLIIITGMHYSFTPFVFQTLANPGYEPFVLLANVYNNVNQGIASLAVALRSKNKNLKATATTCGVTAVVCGVTEPALYGITLKLRTPLYAVMIGNLCAGLVGGFLKVVTYAFAGSWGVFAIPAYIGPNGSNVLYMIIGLVVGCIVTFVLTLILYKEETVIEG